MSDKLKIRAESIDDLKIVSALFQDALIRVEDIDFARASRRFVMLANRFCWEKAKRRWFRKPSALRVRSALRFDFVDHVQFIGLERNNPAQILEVLAVTAGPLADSDHVQITISFAGGAALKLVVEVIDATLDDLSPPWAAQTTPTHHIS